MVLKTVVSTARTGTTSVRVTIPEGIADFLELQAGDTLSWKMEIKDGKRYATVEKEPIGLDENTIKTASKYAKKKVV